MDIRGRFHVNTRGIGKRALVFVHGFGCEQTMWRFVAPAFETDHRVVLFDLAGCGRADPSAYDKNRHASLAGYAEDVLDICRSLELENAVLVGHSVAAMIGVLAAIRRPEQFSGLVLVAPSPRYVNAEGYLGGFTRADIDGLIDSLDTNYLGWASTVAPMIMGNPERPELTQELHNSFCRMNPDIARAFARVTFLSDNRDDLPKVRTRSLLLQVTNDVIAPVSVGDYMHRRLPQNELVLLNTRGHCPHLSAPRETIAAISTWLAAH